MGLNQLYDRRLTRGNPVQTPVSHMVSPSPVELIPECRVRIKSSASLRMGPKTKGNNPL